MSASKPGWPYDVLGLGAGETDKKAVRRAYARALKGIDQSTNAEGFQNLRRAYETALQRAEAPSRSITEGGHEEPITDDAFSAGAAPRDTAVDDIEATHAPGFETNWSRIDDIRAALFVAQPGESTDARMRRLWEDPVFQDPNAATAMENHLYQHMRSALTYQDAGPEFSDLQCLEYLPFIKETFQWFSDSIRFQEKFAQASDILVAARSAGFNALKPRQKNWKDFNARSGTALWRPSKLVITALIVGFVAYLYSRDPDADSGALGAILLYGFGAGHLLHLPVMALAYWVSLDQVIHVVQRVGDYTLTGRAWLAWFVALALALFACPYLPDLAIDLTVYALLVFPIVAVTFAVLSICLAAFLWIAPPVLAIAQSLDSCVARAWWRAWRP